MTNPPAINIRTKKLAVLIRDARQAVGKNRKECAEVLGITPKKYSSYELGTKSPSLPELEVLSYFLNVSIDHFQGNMVASENAYTADIRDRLPRVLTLRQRIIGARMRQTRQNANITISELSKRTKIPTGRLKRYETGQQPIPLPELRALASTLRHSVQEFEATKGPVGKWVQEQRMVQAFLELPPELQVFATQSANRPYLEIAQRLSDMPVEKLRSVAEGLLEITL